MGEILKKLVKLFPEITIKDQGNKFFHFSNLIGNSELEFEVEENDLSIIENLPLNEIVFFKEFFGISFDNKIELLLDISNKRKKTIALVKFLEEPIELKINYKSQILKITISKDTDSLISILNSLIRYQRARIILTIETEDQLTEEEVKDVLNCAFFDLHYNTNIFFEPVNVDFPIRVPIYRSKQKKVIPLEFTFKKYSAELIEYFKTAEKVDYLPFKYLCYFHILEYLMDRSAYLSASKKIKHIMFKPDFHLNMDKYIAETINFFKKESDKHQTDLHKIERVISLYVEREEILKFAKEKRLDLSKANVFPCNEKNLSLPAIKDDFNNELFTKNLSKRIYNLRCSIVHSNPDFDEKKAIPFVPNKANLDKLLLELSLIEEIAKIIIIKTAI